jgi:hypothetical protein
MLTPAPSSPEEKPPQAHASPDSSGLPRFTWPMRCLLVFLLIQVVGQSLVSLAPYERWAKELGMERFPDRLPTLEEWRTAETPVNQRSNGERLLRSLQSMGHYFKPWPSAAARTGMTRRATARRAAHAGGQGLWVGDWADRGKFALCWVGTRLQFQQNLVGLDESWLMFAPSVLKSEVAVRFRLVYEDGTETVVHTLTDPEDLTHYTTHRLLSEKILQYSSKLVSERSRRLGYCNLLAHRHPTNAAGSPLVQILLVKIEYIFPGPAEDAKAFLAAQNGPPGWERRPPFFAYHVQTRTGRDLPVQ